MSLVKCSRSAFFATSSGRPGSWIGTSPRESDSTFSGTMSRAQTSWPSSAKQAAVTRPTQPTPMTPIGSFSALMRSRRLVEPCVHRPEGEYVRERLVVTVHVKHVGAVLMGARRDKQVGNRDPV